MQEHQDTVRALAKPGGEIAANITAEEAHLLHMAVGVCGEAGELLDAIKKHVIYRQPLDQDNVIEELGDIEFYLEGLRQGAGVDRRCALERNVAKLRARYGKAYSDQAARARKDKEAPHA